MQVTFLNVWRKWVYTEWKVWIWILRLTTFNNDHYMERYSPICRLLGVWCPHFLTVVGSVPGCVIKVTFRYHCFPGRLAYLERMGLRTKCKLSYAMVNAVDTKGGESNITSDEMITNCHGRLLKMKIRLMKIKYHIVRHYNIRNNTVKTKKKLFFYYVKLTNLLSFQTRFPNSGTGLIRGTKHRKDNQLQRLELPTRIP